MSEVLMGIFAAVLAALALGAVALLTSRVHALTRGLDYRLDVLTNQLTATTQTANAKSGATLRAEVDALVGALDVMRASNRREFGSLWGRLGGRTLKDALEIDVPPRAQVATSDEFEALLALQNSPPVGPPK